MIPRAFAAPSSIAGMVGQRGRPFVAALLLCALPFLPANAVQPNPQEVETSEEYVGAVRLVTLGMGSSVDGGSGPLGLLSALLAGETTPVSRARLGTASLLGGSAAPAGPLAAFAFLTAGEHWGCWRLLDTDQVSAIPEPSRIFITDRKGVSATENESQVYWSTVYRAGQTADAAFRAAARTNWPLQPLRKNPAAFRGDVFYLEGRLDEIEPLAITRIGQDQLVSDVYTARLTDAAGTACTVRFTELPPGIRAVEGASFEVSFAGYFYKWLPRGDGFTPLFIGRTVRPLPAIQQRLPQATTALLLACQAGPGESTAPLTALALFHAADRLGYWKLFAPAEEPSLRRDLLLRIRDEGFFPSLEEKDKAELEAYADFLVVASRTSPEGFGAKSRSDVSYSQMMNQPLDYRGKVIHIDGTLKKLLEHKAPMMLRLAGISMLYEAWIFDETNGNNPFCVVLTELPKGLKPAKTMTEHVSLDAYFFKRGDYQSSDRNEGERRRSPLLVGRTLTVLPQQPDHEAGLGDALLYAGMSFILATIVTIFIFTVWYRRSDHRAQLRLQAARTREFVLPPQDAVPIAAPVAPVPAAGEPLQKHETGG